VTLRILVRGGGDLASGSALRLWRAGWEVIVTELPQPRVVRRLVSFAQAVYDGNAQVEEATAERVDDFGQAAAALKRHSVAVLVDPDADVRKLFCPHVILDGRMRKSPPEIGMDSALLTIGLGPGFTAGLDCHVVIETMRGPFLGRVIWQGSAERDTGIPEKVAGRQLERILRAPAAGVLEPNAEIGTFLKTGDTVARVAGLPVKAAFDGVLRGLIMGGVLVKAGEKIGDIDPRADPRLCYLVSDKSLAVSGGVLEAILSFPGLQSHLSS